jgi:hypothetical protein
MIILGILALGLLLLSINWDNCDRWFRDDDEDEDEDSITGPLPNPIAHDNSH